MSKGNIVKVAAVQAAPVFMDLQGGVDKTISLIEDAAKQGCDLIAFPETWLPGYPWFIWLHNTMTNMKYFGQYHANSLVVGGDEFNRIADAAKNNNILVSLGASEKDHGSLYIAQFLFDRDGTLLSKRRKLKPTHMERTVFGDGDGASINVSETDIGRVGQLACWEHLQPLTKYAMYSMHEQIHCAAWPAFCMYTQAPALSWEVNNAASRMYAVEGQCFVLATSSMISKEILDILDEKGEYKDLITTGGGHAVIYGPDGEQLVEKLPEDQEGLLIADLNMDSIVMAKVFADPVGHYSRPDVTRLLLNRQPQPVTEDYFLEEDLGAFDAVEDNSSEE